MIYGLGLPGLVLILPGILCAAENDDWRHEIRDRQYDRVRNISLEILKQWSTSEDHLVIVGRSGTPIRAFFELILGNQSVTQIPLSNFRFALRHLDHRIRIRYPLIRRLSAEEEMILFGHFDKLDLHEKLATKNRLLLFDYASNSGTSLLGAADYLRLYASHRGIRLRVVPIAVVERDNKIGYLDHLGVSQELDLADYLRSEGVFVIQSGPWDHWALAWELYKRVSPVGRFFIQEKQWADVATASETRYRDYKNWLSGRIRFDWATHGFLRDRFPECRQILQPIAVADPVFELTDFPRSK